jgi:hypothetical protein
LHFPFNKPKGIKKRKKGNSKTMTIIEKDKTIKAETILQEIYT